MPRQVYQSSSSPCMYLFKSTKHVIVPISVAVRSKACDYGRSFAGIVGSNPAEGMDVLVFFVCCGGSGLCDGPTPRPGESCRVCVSN